MYLKELSNWTTSASSYWSPLVSAAVSAQNLLNLEGQQNPATIMTSINNKLNELISAKTSYYGNTDLYETVKDSLASLYSYVNLKDVVVAASGPTIPDLIDQNTGVKVWFKTFTYTLPAYNTLFTLTTPEVTGNVILVDTGCSGLKSIINGAASSDIATINSFINILSSNTKDSILYRMFARPSITFTDSIDIKSQILVTYKFNDVFAEFPLWQIQGLNV